MLLSSYKDALLELAWPARCVGCERPGTLLCERCAERLGWIAQSSACPRCGAPFGRLVCTECNNAEGQINWSFDTLRSCFVFDEIAALLSVVYKDGGERRLAPLIADFLAHSLPPAWAGQLDLISYIPASQEALRRRGFDHMHLVAARLAEKTELPWACLLRQAQIRDQRGLGQTARRDNLQNAFHLAEDVSADELKGLRLLLVDDVCTSAATLDSAAGLLKESGTAQVRCLSLC
ncbi:MAG: double zinc ribbon domain-containing protein, partial [Coriobacteriales bacterium]|nr:double zinc ribbon domain-containing protein [Coriobacteriales bacterium]